MTYKDLFPHIYSYFLHRKDLSRAKDIPKDILKIFLVSMRMEGTDYRGQKRKSDQAINDFVELQQLFWSVAFRLEYRKSALHCFPLVSFGFLLSVAEYNSQVYKQYSEGNT